MLSDALDVPALRKVYQAGHATAWQLYRALNPVYDESKWKSFVRRLGILSERHFLIRLVVDGMAAPVFALGDEGARSLQGRLPTVIEAGPRDSNRGDRDHVWHDVGKRTAKPGDQIRAVDQRLGVSRATSESFR